MILKLDASGPPKIAYQPPDYDPKDLWPSEVYGTVRRLFDPSYPTDRLSAVHDRLATEPGGKALGEIAVETGAWTDK